MSDFKSDRAEHEMQEAGKEIMAKAAEKERLEKENSLLIEKNAAQEIFDKIKEWEHSYGESFTDRFMHDNVRDNSWAFWLLGKGYAEHANAIIIEILAGDTCIDLEVLYNIYPEYNDEDGADWNEENYYKNAMLWAEFLVSTPFYLDKVNEFFKED